MTPSLKFLFNIQSDPFFERIDDQVHKITEGRALNIRVALT
jgi:hypothetical protein